MNFVQWTATTEALLCAVVIGICGAIVFMGSFAFHRTDDNRTSSWFGAVGCELIALSLMLISMCASASDDTLGTVIMAGMSLMFAALGLVVVFSTERHEV